MTADTLPATRARRTAENGTEPAPLNLWQRIVAIHREAANVAKNGLAPPEMGGFRFVLDTDVKDAAREFFAQHGISYLPTMVSEETEQAGTTSKGSPIYRSKVVIEIRLRNMDAPDEIEVVRWASHGDDQHDKGLSKAATSAIKYATLNILQIGGGPGADADSADPTGGEGRTAVPADHFGRCDEIDCPGWLVAAEVNTKGGRKRIVKCSTDTGPGKGCGRRPDWNPTWAEYARRRTRMEEPDAAPMTSAAGPTVARAAAMADGQPDLLGMITTLLHADGGEAMFADICKDARFARRPNEKTADWIGRLDAAQRAELKLVLDARLADVPIPA